MGFSHGWVRRILECFWERFLEFHLDLGLFLEKNRKKGKTKKSGQKRVPTPMAPLGYTTT